MEEPYWTIDGTLIFEPYFNEESDNYYDVISQYNKLIFSNYSDSEIIILTENKYDDKYNNKYIGSKFNKKLELTENITHISFGFYFNQKVKLT